MDTLARTVVALTLTVALVGACDRFAPEAAAQEGTGHAELDGPLVVYVVRHAERESLEGNDDPPLTEAGVARAQALAQSLPLDRLVAVYSSPFARTRATVAPTAMAAGLDVIEVEAHDIDGLVAHIRTQPHGAVLVAGHSDTVPVILVALGVPESVVIGEVGYGDIFVVLVGPDGAQFERAHFGP
jgi:hypothetical protein